MPSRTKNLLVAVVAISGLALAACSSSDTKAAPSAPPSSAGPTSAAPTGAAATSAAPTGGSAVSASTIRVGAEASGGRAGSKAAGTPLHIGFITDNGIQGLDGVPFLNAMQAVVAFINTDLGGINGRPLEVDTCQITQSEDQGTVCAQQMVNDKSVVAIVTGAINFGDTEILNTVKGSKPIFAAIPSGPADAVAPNLFGFNGGVLAAGSMLTYAAKDLKAKTVSIIGAQDPVTAQIVGLWKQILTGMGVSKVTTSLFGYAATDLTSTIAASGATHADAIILAATNTAPCIAIAKGLQQMKVTKPTISLGNCADPAVRRAVGDLPKWTYYSPYRNTQADDPTGQSAAYTEAVTRYANGALAASNFAPSVFATVITLAAIMNRAGADPTSPSISAEAAKFAGPVFLGPEKVAFGTKPFPSLGIVAGLLYNYAGNGQWTAAADGKWVAPPAA